MYNKKIFKSCFVFRGKYLYKNITMIPYYCRRIHHLIKYGYDETAVWDTFDWFIFTMKNILKEYKNGRCGYKVTDNSVSDEENQKMWDEIIDKMISLLEKMDENTYNYHGIEEWIEVKNKIGSSKNEFFKLFSKYFYDLWD